LSEEKHDAKEKHDSKDIEYKTPIIIEGKQEGKEFKYECDFLILACPIQELLEAGVIVDAKEVEKQLFGKQRYVSLVTHLYNRPHEDVETLPSAVTSWVDALDADVDGSTYTEHHSRKVRRFDTPLSKRDNFVGFQYFSDYGMVVGQEEKIKSTLIENIAKAHHLKKEDVVIKEQHIWRYFPHFNQAELNAVYPEQIFDMQANFRTWYIGASACFESIYDVVNYNLMLVDYFIDLKD